MKNYIQKAKALKSRVKNFHKRKQKGQWVPISLYPLDLDFSTAFPSLWVATGFATYFTNGPFKKPTTG